MLKRFKSLGLSVKITFILMILISLTASFFIFKDIFTYELHHAYTADAPLYWAVGRGMLNGLTPYAQMYENKPLGIFLISALSFGLTGSSIICNIFSILAALMITFIPVLAVLNGYDQNDHRKTDTTKKLVVSLMVLMGGLLITTYTEMRSGGFQVEAIGAAFSVLFIYLVMKLKNAKTRRQTVILTVCSALALGCSVMIKEPFLLTCVFGALLFIDSFKSFLKHLLLPCAAGGVLVLIVLAVSGTLPSYFSIYISRMFGTRLAGDSGSSAFTRAKNILFLTKDIRNFNVWLFYLLIAFLVFTLLYGILKKRKVTFILMHVIKVAAAIFAASFCVGMGGQYYNHHYIFAVPIYVAFLICGAMMFYEFDTKNLVPAVAIWGVVLAAVILSIGNPYAGDYTAKYHDITVKAQYVDSLLDHYQEDRYQFIGFNGEDAFIGLTEHSPRGPVFAQDPDNFRSADTWFAQNLLQQIDESNIVIVKEFKSPAVDEEIQRKLNAEFTESPTEKYEISPPEGFNCRIYYRTSKYQ
ncbi:MAG: hypothetical protein IJH32_07950 [Ruminococcus sp.]|nr:hypothetical protein [Ruminococcus sp.]